MKEVILDIVNHKGKQILLFKFPYDTELTSLVKTLPGASWSRTYKGWYVLFKAEMLTRSKEIFKEKARLMAPGLKEKLAKIAEQREPLKDTILSEEVLADIERFKSWMSSRRYSESTILTYVEALKSFLKFCNDRALAEISNEDVIRYNNDYILKNGLSASYQNQVVNALKLFFRTIQSRKLNAEEIHRPKRSFVLPVILSPEEVAGMLNSLENIKHKTMLALIYSGGLRRSELLNLRLEDIDSKRMFISIKAAKGKKDRMVPLSEMILEMLRLYYKEYKPQHYLFEGQKAGKYTESSLEEVFHKAKKLAGIKKSVSLHTLRHSYATHLLEGGTNLRYIQELLGHKSPKTTQIYTHVTNDGLSRVLSPIEKLKLKF
ncbi:MAG: Integrase/recombinase [Bacteroidota bacterium]|jgi:integrase/recombinase XerD|nr:Integrase/recombinase [Bacteroidota bacterium]